MLENGGLWTRGKIIVLKLTWKFLYLKGKVVGKTVHFIRIIHDVGKKHMSFWAYKLFWGRCAHILLNNKSFYLLKYCSSSVVNLNLPLAKNMDSFERLNKIEKNCMEKTFLFSLWKVVQGEACSMLGILSAQDTCRLCILCSFHLTVLSVP